MDEIYSSLLWTSLDIFEDFIELGIDVIQLDQQWYMGLEALSIYAGRM